MIFAQQPPEDESTILHWHSGNVSIYVRRYMFGQYRLQFAIWDERYIFNPVLQGPEC